MTDNIDLERRIMQVAIEHGLWDRDWNEINYCYIDGKKIRVVNGKSIGTPVDDSKCILAVLYILPDNAIPRFSTDQLIEWFDWDKYDYKFTKDNKSYFGIYIYHYNSSKCIFVCECMTIRECVQKALIWQLTGEEFVKQESK